jgi:hypothetical protein
MANRNPPRPDPEKEASLRRLRQSAVYLRKVAHLYLSAVDESSPAQKKSQAEFCLARAAETDANAAALQGDLAEANRCLDLSDVYQQNAEYQRGTAELRKKVKEMVNNPASWCEFTPPY